MKWIFLYRKKIDPSDIILPDKLYSYFYHITAPELTPESVREALDVLPVHFPEIVNMVLWGEPLANKVEFSVKFKEPSELIGKPHNEFLVQIENFAASHYVYLDLLETAVFLPRWPWWLLGIGATLALITIGAEVKKRKGG